MTRDSRQARLEVRDWKLKPRQWVPTGRARGTHFVAPRLGFASLETTPSKGLRLSVRLRSGWPSRVSIEGRPEAVARVEGSKRFQSLASPARQSQKPGRASLQLLGLLVACYLSLVASTEAARIEYHEGLPVVFLSGTPYELGYQHGTLLRNEVRAAVQRVLGYFRQYLKIPWISLWVVNWWLDVSWESATPFIPPGALEELRGLSEGSGVALQELYRLHAIPDRTSSCSSFAAWGEATTGGRLIHMRNLDWSTQAGIQDFPVVFVVHPDGKQAFVNVGWAGFIGVLTGINEQELSIGQIGAKTLDTTSRGEPMVFLMRRVMEQARDLKAASAIIMNARRTIGANYVIADAKAKRAVVIETTARHAHIFESNDPAERMVRYARPMVDVVFRADTAVDPIIRNRQLASHGNPTRPGVEDPRGSSAYDVRYLGQAVGLSALYGALDSESAKHVAQAVAPSSNIQSVIFAWPQLWVANAKGTASAASRRYQLFDLEQLLEPAS